MTTINDDTREIAEQLVSIVENTSRTNSDDINITFKPISLHELSNYIDFRDYRIKCLNKGVKRLKDKINKQSELIKRLEKENQDLRGNVDTKIIFFAKENVKLRELLKECRDFIELVQIIDGGKPDILTKIDNAMGEK